MLFFAGRIWATLGPVEPLEPRQNLGFPVSLGSGGWVLRLQWLGMCAWRGFAGGVKALPPDPPRWPCATLTAGVQLLSGRSLLPTPHNPLLVFWRGPRFNSKAHGCQKGKPRAPSSTLRSGVLSRSEITRLVRVLTAPVRAARGPNCSRTSPQAAKAPLKRARRTKLPTTTTKVGKHAKSLKLMPSPLHLRAHHHQMGSTQRAKHATAPS